MAAYLGSDQAPETAGQESIRTEFRDSHEVDDAVGRKRVWWGEKVRINGSIYVTTEPWPKSSQRIIEFELFNER